MRGLSAIVLSVLLAVASLTPTAHAVAAVHEITGTVDGPDGQPVAGVWVTVRRVDSTHGARVQVDSAGRYRAQVPVTGRYLVFAVPPSTSTLAAAWSPGVPDRASAAEVTVTDGGTAMADVALVEGATVSGQLLVTPAPAPTSDFTATVLVHPEETALASVSRLVRVAPDGTWSVTGVARVPHVIRVGGTDVEETWAPGVSEEAAAVAVPVVGDHVDVAPFTVHARPTLLGTVRVLGTTPVPAVCHQVGLVQWESVEGRTRHSSTSTVFTASADGSFRAAVQRPGTYGVTASPGCTTHEVRMAGEEQEFTVAARQHLTDVDVEIVPFGRLTGRVDLPAGAPETEIGVRIHRLHPVSRRWEHRTEFDRSVRADGTWSAPVPAGTYRVSTVGVGSTFRESWAARDGVREFTVAPETETTGVDAALTHVPVPPVVRPPTPAPPKVITVVKKPVVSGKARVGRTLKASRGTWRPGTVRVTYRWQSRKAGKVTTLRTTTSTLKVTKKLRGRLLRVTITVTAPGHASRVVHSAWTKKVA